MKERIKKLHVNALKEVCLFVFKCVFLQFQTGSGTCRQVGESEGGGGAHYQSVFSHWGRKKTDAPSEREEGTERWRQREEKQRGEPGK